MKDHYFRKLTVWQRAMQFTTDIYSLTERYPQREQFGLVDQLRRAATSIALNIAEGAGSGSNPEFSRFLHMAKRSGYEVITALEISKNLGYGKEEKLDSLIQEADQLCAMIVGLQSKLKQ